MEGQNENDELYPIAVLIDELKVQTSSALPSITEGESTGPSSLVFP